MHPDLVGISDHMQTLGLGILSQAQKNVFFWHYVNLYETTVFGVLQTAHAAEILIKACIAQIDPLLIFTNASKFTDSNGALVDSNGLFENGRTLEYSKLPKKLEEVTRYKILDIDLYNDLGKTRNIIQHFAHPEGDLSELAGDFIYEVLDPLMGHFWNLYAVEYCDDDESEIYLLEALVRKGISFRYPPHYEEYVKDARGAVDGTGRT
jgi:hypothetical protein